MMLRSSPVPESLASAERATENRPSAGTIAVRAREALSRHFGYPDFRPGQLELVQAVIDGRDALGILPTGGGKSVCYQVPGVLLPHLTVVVSPLVSLMADQVERCHRAGIPAAFLNSTLSAHERNAVQQAAVAGAIKVLFVAPERFESRAFERLAPRLRVSLLAVDEAHCISEWGHDFRPAYLRLGRVRSLFAAPVLALTATATPRTRDEIASRLALRAPVTVVGGFDRPNLVWEVQRARSRGEKRALIGQLLREYPGTVVIYASSRKGVEVVRDHLAALGRRTEAYHAGLPPAERTRVQTAFMEGSAPTVVATNAFGMGIDKSDVRLVVHHELPRTLEAYYQEAGRAGRDGEIARCVALWSDADRAGQMAFIDRQHPPARDVRRLWRTLCDIAGEQDSLEVRLTDIPSTGRTPLTPAELGALLRTLATCRAVRLRADLPEDADGLLRLDLAPHRRRLPREALHGRRRAEVDKLASMQRYARTNRCRRAEILRYFGDLDTPTGCGACDNCRNHLAGR